MVASVHPLGITQSTLASAGGRYLQFYSTTAQTSFDVAVIAADGTVKPTVQVLPFEPRFARASSDGDRVALTWNGDCHDAVGANPYAYSSCAAIIDPDGAMLGSTVSQFPGNFPAHRAEIAGGELFIAGLRDEYEDAPLEAEIVTGADLTTHSVPVTLSIAEDSGILPAVAYDGHTFLVVWSALREDTGFDLVAVRVTPDGAVLDASPVALVTRPGNQTNVSLVFDGAQFRISWTDTDGIRASMLSTSLQMQYPEGKTLVAGSSYAVERQGCVIATDGTQTLLAYTETQSVPVLQAVRLDTDWNPIPPGAFTVHTAPDFEDGISDVSVSYGGHFLISWAREDFFEPEIHAARVSTTGQVLDHLVVDADTDEPGKNQFPLVGTRSVFGADRFFVTWVNKGVSQYPGGARVGVDGSLPDVDGFDLVPDEFGVQTRAPSIAFDGTEFVVGLEHEDNGLRVVSIGASGGPSPAQNVALPADQLRPNADDTAMASDCAGHTILVYGSGLGTGSHPFVSRIRARMLVRDGSGGAGPGCAIPQPIATDPDAGLAGSGGNGGAAGAGGTGQHDAGPAGAAGALDSGPEIGSGVESNDSSTGGCGCVTPGTRSPAAGRWWIAAVALGLASAAIRKRRA